MRAVIAIIIGILLTSCKQLHNYKQDKIFDDRNVFNLSQNQEEKTLTPEIENSDAKINQQNKADEYEISKIDKLHRERDELKEATKRIIERSLSIPTIKIDSIGNRFYERRNSYLETPCDDLEYKNLNHFSIEFNKQYIHSSENSGNYDGKTFCLRQLKESNLMLSKIFFGRSEGGHTSDAITLITFNDQEKLIFILPLSYYTGWDGHETTVESNLKENIITRKITERYGWSNTDPDSLINQPRRVVTQQILINENGSMKVVNEQIRKYNIDELFE